MGIASTGYKILFLFHILSAIIGFGAVLLNGLYGAEVKKRKGADGLAIFRANERASNVGMIFILLVPLWGIGLVFMSDGIWAFGQLWVWLALVIYVVALSFSFAVLHPAVKRQGALMEELVGLGAPPAGGAPAGPPPQVALLEANGKRLAAAGSTLHLALVVILVLMIWKPGI